DGIRDFHVTGVQTCALPIYPDRPSAVKPELSETHSRFLPVPTKTPRRLFPPGADRQGIQLSDTVMSPLAVVSSSTRSAFGSSPRSEERRVGKTCRSQGDSG